MYFEKVSEMQQTYSKLEKQEFFTGNDESLVYPPAFETYFEPLYRIYLEQLLHMR